MFVAKEILVNQLEYAADLVQNSGVDINGTVYRSAVIIKSCSVMCIGHIQCRVSYAKINGTKYSIGNILLCGFYNDDQPGFGKLVDIVSLKDLYWLILKPCLIKKFNEHYNAFEIEVQIHEHIVIQQEDLADHHPLTISKSFNSALKHSDFVVLKYHVFP